MFRTTLAAAAMFIASVFSANASTFEITGFQNLSAQGFGSTLFHKATGCSGMCGATIAKSAGTGSGNWNSATGAMSFTMDLVGGGLATASGTINTTSRVDGAAVGVAGTLEIILSGITGTYSSYNGTYDFLFADTSHNPVANWFEDGVIGLWGGAPATNANGGAIGSDWRIEVTPAPLPASILLLGAGVAGLGFMRRRQKATA